MEKRNFKRLQMAMFSRSAKMMSEELQARRSHWESEYMIASEKARRRHRKRFHRTCEYCMHSCYQELVVELTSFLSYGK